MSKITVSETVSRSIAVDNSIADIQTALVRCFQFLEERRFKEASLIIEQVLNIDPNNTDAHVANFLYHFELTSAEDVVKTFGRCVTYENSVFYKRVKKCAQTELSKKLDFCLGRASEQLEKFNRRIEEEAQQRRIEEEAQQRRIKEEAQQNRREIEKAVIRIIIILAICAVIGFADAAPGWKLTAVFTVIILNVILSVYYKS